MTRGRGVALLALRLLARDWRAGDLGTLSLALLLAVASLTTVGFFTERVRLGMAQEATRFLGADLVVVADHPLPVAYEEEALRLGLHVARSLRFPSMAVAGEHAVLSEIKAVGPGYPLRGQLLVEGGEGVPAPGAALVDAQGFSRLALAVGGQVRLGEAALRVQARLTEDPEASGGFFALGPHIVIGLADVPATGLLQEGARVTHRLGVAGTPADVARFQVFARTRLGRGEHLQDLSDARPELRAALDRAEHFLSLAALLGVLLCAAAVALAARHYVSRHLDNCAVMRALGATQSLVLGLHASQVLVLGALASAGGSILGLAGAQVLARLLAPLAGSALPAAGLGAALPGMGAGMLLLLGFVLPPLHALGRVPALRVLRRDLPAPGARTGLGYLPGALVVMLLLAATARDLRLGLYVVGGAAAVALACLLVTGALLLILARVESHLGFAWRFGLANLRRRALGTFAQVLALCVGLLALSLLSVVRTDLLASWQASLGTQAPNHFLANVQPSQLEGVKALLSRQGVAVPTFFPMVRGRLLARNGVTLDSANLADERARRLLDREFNLSTASLPQPDNRITAGRWWQDAAGPPQFSVEEGLAHTLGIGLGDRLAFRVSGQLIEGEVRSLRKVQWDSFQVNFFVVASPGTLDGLPRSLVASFHLTPGQLPAAEELGRRFPGLLVIDVRALVTQAERLLVLGAEAVEVISLFALAAGLTVLVAGLSLTHDERARESAILRTLGASRRQVAFAQGAEFALLGALAGLVAGLGASAIGAVLALRVFDIPFRLDLLLCLGVPLASSAGVVFVGLLGTRRARGGGPVRVLRQLA